MLFIGDFTDVALNAIGLSVQASQDQQNDNQKLYLYFVYFKLYVTFSGDRQSLWKMKLYESKPFP